MANAPYDSDFEDFYARIRNASAPTGVYPTSVGSITSRPSAIYIGSRSFDAEQLGALLQYLLDTTPESQI